MGQQVSMGGDNMDQGGLGDNMDQGGWGDWGQYGSSGGVELQGQSEKVIVIKIKCILYML